LPRENNFSPVRIGISVPKKRTPLAVHRNRTKRLIRESWRLSKHSIYDKISNTIQLHLFFIYIGPSNPDFAQIQVAIQKSIVLLQKELNQTVNAEDI
jgi:ribonuclease P protein component